MSRATAQDAATSSDAKKISTRRMFMVQDFGQNGQGSKQLRRLQRGSPEGIGAVEILRDWNVAFGERTLSLTCGIGRVLEMQ